MLSFYFITTQVSVTLTADSLTVFFSSRRYISGTLFKTIDTSSSTWFIGVCVCFI